jgi:hypothetical protein
VSPEVQWLSVVAALWKITVGFDRVGIAFLAGHAAQRRFGRTATIGRHWLFADSRDVHQIVRAYFPGVERPGFQGFSEEFLRALGSTELVSLDASDYEDATELHDMNFALPAAHRNRYDTIIDAGSLEHVFDVKTALANVMTMPVSGGRVLLILPANNQLGHGFYQFSPEVFFRAFSPANGYRLESMHMVVHGWRPRFYRVTDPLEIGARAELRTAFPAYLYIEATRTEVIELFTEPVQQSDYSAAWNGVVRASSEAPIGRRLGRTLPPRLKDAARLALKAWDRRRNRSGYTRVADFGQ